MNRIMILATAMVVIIAGMAVEAEAGLFNRKKKCKQQCCEPVSCCQPAPTCCEPAPTCCEPAPAPCCEPAPCGCAAAPAPCGCEVQTCGCEAAPSCGCETDCNCLSRRQLRKANRKGQCCGAKPNTCNVCSTTCSAPVSACGCSSAAPAGCSTCEGAVMESAPVPAAEEAAPEAPESTT